MAQKIDGMVRLFDGDVTLGELLSMDIPSQKVLVQARMENLRKSQEAYSQGRLDAYSRRYASTMSLGGTSSKYITENSNSSSPEAEEHPTIDRSHSLNIKDRFLNED